MASVNKVILLGNLGKDPEVRNTSGGKSVATLRLATTDTWTDASGQRQEKTEWRTAFFVGDLKQSLYGWRAGNPELLRMVDGLIPNKGDNRLDFTHRCAQPVVELVNRLLGDLDGCFFQPRCQLCRFLLVGRLRRFQLGFVDG